MGRLRATLEPRSLALLIATLLACAPRIAAACPSCEPAIEARAAIRSDPDLLLQASVTVLPFLLVAIVAILLHRMGRPRPDGDIR